MSNLLMHCAVALEKEGIDFLELSGGNYESSRSALADEKGTSTQRREAYFLDFARKVKPRCLKMPLMLTGGFRSYSAMEAALKLEEATFLQPLTLAGY